MKAPVRIHGFLGQHDEGGASIVDADGKHICTTTSVYTFGSAQDAKAWHEYNENNRNVVEGLNLVLTDTN